MVEFSQIGTSSPYTHIITICAPPFSDFPCTAFSLLKYVGFDIINIHLYPIHIVSLNSQPTHTHSHEQYIKWLARPCMYAKCENRSANIIHYIQSTSAGYKFLFTFIIILYIAEFISLSNYMFFIHERWTNQINDLLSQLHLRCQEQDRYVPYECQQFDECSRDARTHRLAPLHTHAHTNNSMNEMRKQHIYSCNDESFNQTRTSMCKDHTNDCF